MQFLNEEEFNKLKEGDFSLFCEILSRVHNSSVEAAMRMTPPLAAKLIKEGVLIHKIKSKFFDDNPEFIKHKDVVQQIVQKTEEENPGMDYKRLLETATPLIRKKIVEVVNIDQLNMFPAEKPKEEGWWLYERP